MSASPSWDIVAKIFVQIQLRLVLAQEREKETTDADDCVHSSVDGGPDRALPRRATQTMPATCAEPESWAGDISK